MQRNTKKITQPNVCAIFLIFFQNLFGSKQKLIMLIIYFLKIMMQESLINKRINLFEMKK